MTANIPLPDVDTVVKTARTYARDLAERVVTTFLQAFVGALVLTSPFDLHMWQAAAMGGVAAALSLIKGMIARARSVANSASLAKGV
ncbi:holin [Streptomyces sp. NPDC004376]